MKTLIESLLDNEIELIDNTDIVKNFPDSKDTFTKKVYDKFDRKISITGYHWSNPIFNILGKHITGINIYWSKSKILNYYNINVNFEYNNEELTDVQGPGYICITNKHDKFPNKTDAKKLAYKFLEYIKNNPSVLKEIDKLNKKQTFKNDIFYIEDVMK